MTAALGKRVAGSLFAAGVGSVLLLAGTESLAGGNAAGGSQVVRVAGARDGILLFVGTPMNPEKEGGILAAGRIEINGQLVFYRKFREGDRVEVGQVLAQTDWRLAELDRKLAAARLIAAQAEAANAIFCAKEAQARMDRFEALMRGRGQGRHSLAPEDYAAVVLARDRCKAEAEAKEAAVKLREVDLKRAEVVLDMHTIRSPVRGVVHRIVKQAGEGARAFDTVIEIRPDDKK